MRHIRTVAALVSCFLLLACTDYATFVTSTDIGFTAATAPVPSSIKFGYNREELSIIPLRREQPLENTRDKYAPVLASIDLNLGGSTATDTNLGIRQFFATGSAARNLAINPEIQ